MDVERQDVHCMFIPWRLFFRTEQVSKLAAVSFWSRVSLCFLTMTKQYAALGAAARCRSAATIADPCRYTTRCSYSRWIKIRRRLLEGSVGDKMITRLRLPRSPSVCNQLCRKNRKAPFSISPQSRMCWMLLSGSYFLSNAVCRSDKNEAVGESARMEASDSQCPHNSEAYLSAEDVGVPTNLGRDRSTRDHDQHDVHHPAIFRLWSNITKARQEKEKTHTRVSRAKRWHHSTHVASNEHVGVFVNYPTVPMVIHTK